MKSILITGASGFIGKALCTDLGQTCKVTGIYHRNRPADGLPASLELADITDSQAVASLFRRVVPDVVIHCAAIAHQHIGAVDKASYLRVNSESTESIAKAAYESNPKVLFIFLSSVSVYGENNLQVPVTEAHACRPTSDYGLSKLNAEQRLASLPGIPGSNLPVILRLAPVYDRVWGGNLDRRVLSPFNLSYVTFGSGRQQMSALARPNLVDFINFLARPANRTPREDRVFNVCSANYQRKQSLLQIEELELLEHFRV